MNIFKCKKLVVTILIFTMFMALARQPLPAAKERRGATVVVTMADGSQSKGELLDVKTHVLLIYDRDALQGQSIDLQQVVQVKVFKKSKLGVGLLIGLSVGFVLGSDPEKNVHIESYRTKTMLKFGLIGGILGAISLIPEKFSLDGKVSRIRQENFAKLKGYAREQDVEEPTAN